MNSLSEAFDKWEAHREHQDHRCVPERCYFCIAETKRSLMSDERVSPKLPLTDHEDFPFND